MWAAPVLDFLLLTQQPRRSGQQRDEVLRQSGLEHDMSGGVICRWKKGGLVIDVMPTDPEILGFSNIWYPYAFALPLTCEVDGVERTKPLLRQDLIQVLRLLTLHC
jgi:hypothetical protein